MAEFKNDDLLLVNRADESYKVPGEALYATYLDKPEIGNLSLVESNPGVNPRFTDQSFVATTTMTQEGQPLSEKTYDAYVEGAILEPAQFIEPLESSDVIDGAWTGVAATRANLWWDIVYGADKWVAISRDGSPGQVMYSSNGLSWTTANAASNKTWSSVTYGEGKFVAVSDATGAGNVSTNIMYSDDGITWTSTASALPSDATAVAVAYGGGTFVTIGGAGTVRSQYSNDGITWSVSVTGIAVNATWTDVTYGNGKFVGVASTASGSLSTKIGYSTDGLNWEVTNAAENNALRGVAYGNGVYVLVSSDGTNRVQYSTDAINWTAVPAAAAETWWAVTFGNGRFVAVARNSATSMYSTDGINWTTSSCPEANQWNSIAYGVDKFIAVSSTGTTRTMWSATGTGIDSTTLNFATGTDMVALAPGDTVNQVSPGTQPDYSGTGTWTSSGRWGEIINKANSFNGNASNYASGVNTFGASQSGTCKWEASAPIPVTSTVRIFVNEYMSAFFSTTFNINNTGAQTITPSGKDPTSNDIYDITPYLGGNELTSIEMITSQVSSSQFPRWCSIIEVDGQVLQDNAVILGPTGTVGSITNTAVSLATSAGDWVNNTDVTGPDKFLVVDNAKKYLAFTGTGEVTALLDAPQSPPYVTTDEDPVLTLTFPSTFPSGFTPDEELGEGVTLTVEVTAENSLGTDGPVSDTVQPSFDAIQFVEPLESYELEYINYSNSEYLSAGGTLNNPENAFDGNLNTVVTSTPAATGYVQAAVNQWPNWEATWNKKVEVYLPDLPLGSIYAACTVNGQDGQIQNNPVGGGWLDFGVISKLDYIKVYPYNGIPQFAAIRIGGEIVANGVTQSGKVLLNFANGTDMTDLEPSDVVTQPGGLSPIYSATTSPTINNPSNMFSAGAIDNVWCDIPNDGVKYTLTTSSIYFDPGARLVIRASGNTGASPAVYFYLNGKEVIDPTASNGASDHIISLGSIDGVMNTFEVKVMPEAGQYQIFGFYTNINSVSGLPDPSTQLVENSPLPDAQGTVGSITGTEVELSTSKNIWRNGPDVTGPDKTPIRSLTTEELEAQKLKFLTYQNRKDVVCGQEAAAARAALLATLTAAGYTEADINQTYSNLDN